jgi:uncharacterized protein YqfB (UPF0267 family)
MENILPLSPLINWEATWLFLNNNHKRSTSYTSFSLCHEKTFKVKLMLGILPTLSHLHSLYPTIYPDKYCISCNTYDSQLHWLTCPNSHILNSTIINTIQQFFNNSRLDITTIQLQELHDKLINHPSISLTNLSRNYTNIYTTIQGFIPITLINTIREYTTSNQSATDTTIKFLIQLSQNIYNQIWKPYCIKLSEWKQQNNIPNQPLYN